MPLISEAAAQLRIAAVPLAGRPCNGNPRTSRLRSEHGERVVRKFSVPSLVLAATSERAAEQDTTRSES